MKTNFYNQNDNSSWLERGRSLFTKWLLCSFIITACLFNSFVGYSQASAPTCPTTFVPANGATDVTIGPALSWSGATGTPLVLGYDVYLGTDSSLVASKALATRVGFGQSGTTYQPTGSGALVGNTTYYWLVVPASSFGRATTCTVNSFTTHATVTKTAIIGGLWSNPATWGGTTAADLPQSNDDVVIPNGVTLTIDQVVSAKSITIGQGGSGAPAASTLQWNATANALTMFGNLTVASNGRLLPYTAAATPSGATINIGGDFTIDGYANLAVTSTTINMCGSTLAGGSSTQTITGTGQIQGNGSDNTVDGIINTLQIGTTGTVTLNTTQNIVVNNTFNDYAGTLATNSKLKIDNTAIIYGQSLNKQLASVPITSMGSGYTAAPVVFGAAVLPWPAAGQSLSVSSNTRYFVGNNVYGIIAASSAVSDGNGPTATTPATAISPTLTSGTATVLWLGTLGSIGNPYPSGGGALTLGLQYFYGDNMYLCTAAGNTSASTAPTHTSGTAVSNAATLLYIGQVGKVSVNSDATTNTVRSLTITNAGTYLTSASAVLAFSPSNATLATTAAAATPVVFQSIQGSLNSLTRKSPSANITGSIVINSGSSTNGFSGVNSLFSATGGVNYTVAPTVGFGLPTLINLVTSGGTGYGTAPTVGFAGGGGTGAAGTAVIANGRVVSVYITNGGSGYTSWPTVTLTGGGFSTAATLASAATLDAGNSLAKATVNYDAATRQIQSYTVTNAGWGYATAPTCGFTTAGTATTAAGVPTARIGLYNLTYGVNSPATTSPVTTVGAEMPSNNKVNILTLGSTAAANNFARITLTSNLNIMAASAALSMPNSTVTSASVLNLNGRTLTFSNPNYAGVGGTPLFGYVTGGDIVLNSIGGSLTRTFPWDAPVAVATGAAGNVALLQCSQAAVGTTVTTASTALIAVGQFVAGTNVPTGATVASVVNGTTFTLSIPTTTLISANTQLTFSAGTSNITQLTCSVVNGPSGGLTAGTGVVATKRAFRIQAVGSMGATGTVQLNYNILDTLSSSTIQQTQLFVGQAGALTGNWTVKSVSSGTANTVLTQTGTNVSRTTAAVVPGLPTPVDLSSQQFFTFVTTTPGNVASSTTGGLWTDPATWANNRVPGSLDTAIIADGAIVTINTAVNVQSVIVGGNGTGAVLQWNGTSNALTVKGNLVVNAGARLNAYTALATPVGQTINLGGNFALNGTANLAAASTVLNFTGSTLLGGSLSQQFSGSGTLIGDTINGGRGIIRTLQIASNGGTVTLNWTGSQKLVTTALNDIAGTLATGGLLSIDNTAQVYGQAFNRQVASLAVTAMGSTFSQAPVVFGAAVTPYGSGLAATSTTYYHSGGNVYLCTVSGTFNSTAPTGTATTTFTTSGPTLLYVGALGTLGRPFQTTALTLGNQYFYGDNLYVANLTTAPGTTPPTHTSGTVGSFTYVGSPAKATVNFNAPTKDVRSLTLTSAGSGYLANDVPAAVFSPGAFNALQTTNATAIAVMFQQIVGPATAVTTKNSAATITGGIASILRNEQGVGGVTVASGGVNYTTLPTIGFPLPTNYLNLVTAGGSGYTSLPTITVTGGSQVAGGTAPTFTVVVAQGKVVSVYATAGGTGWLTLPTLTVTGGGGTGATAAFPANCLATATVTLNNDPAATTGTITNITVTNPGFGYEAAPTPTFATGLTSAVAAGALTSRVGLYDLSYTYNTLNTTNPAYLNGAEVPASRRINKFTMNSVNGATFTNDLEIYGNSIPLTLTNGVVNIASGKTLTFSHQLYRGISGSLTSNVNGVMKATLQGGSLTQLFPFEAPFSVITGTGSLATGSTITNLTASVTAAPTGSNAPIGTRTFRVVPNSGSSYGTVPQVTMSWNANDALTVRNQDLYIGQATSTSGGTNGWSMISAATGSGALAATGNRTSAAVNGVAPSPTVIFTPTGDDYFAWISPLPRVTNATVPAGGNCTPTAQVISADIDPLSPGWQTSPSSGSPSLTYSFNGVAQTAIPMVLLSGTTYTATIPAAATANVAVTWGISATNSFGLSANFVGTTYSDSTFSAANAPTVTAAKSNFCGSGTTANTTTLSVSSPSTGALTYQWSSLGTGTITSSTTASSVTISLTESSDFQVIVTDGGCSTNKKISIGVYPFPASTPTLTPSSVCIGSTAVLSSGLSASNFSVAPINFNRIPIPTPSSVTNFTTLINAGAAVAVPGITTHGSVTGDGGWNNIPIGFTFNYFGTNRTIIGMTTKAVLYMANDNSAANFQYNFPPGFPSTANPAEVIAFCAADYQPSANWTTGAGTIRYWTQGVAPNRIFVVDYNNVAGWSAGATTTQVKLFETTGIVEVHVQSANASSTFSTPQSVKYIGLQEATRTIGATAPNTLTGQANYWNGTGENIAAPLAWRFSPPAPYAVNYSPAGQIAGAASGSNLFNVTASPAAIGTTNYSVTFTDGITGCSNATSPATASLLVVSKPGTPVITSPITVCGSQSVSLTITNAATVPSTSVVNWYDAAVGGNLLATGVTFITPTITSTTTYYVAEENSACSSVRIPVTVVINQPPALTVSNPAVCSPGLTQLSVTSSTSNYDTYIWSPTASLFQDAAGTVQYTGQSLSTVYAKTTASGIYNYGVNAYDFSSGCSNVATSTLTVQPAVDSIISSVPFICVSGTATLSLSPATTAGTVQWQNSSDGITYSDIVGETGNTYVTGTLSTPSYYKVKINSNGSTCLTTNALTLPVNNPQVTSVTDGSVCGGGQVVLSATGPGTLNWYASNSSTTVLGSGATFTTPSILANTDYYVATVVDGCEGTRSVATASITNSTPLVVSGAQVVCNNGIATLSATRQPNFNKYVWTPITNLYKDAAATIALATGDTAATVYARSTTAGITTYTATASNTATSCLSTATVSVTVLPTSVTVSSFPTLVCSGNSAVISASVTSPATLTGASYEWESSSDGVSYTSVATTPTYTTPNVTTTTYYRLTIKNADGVTCFTSSPYTLAIASPEVLTTTDGSSCANPASVTLSATGSVGTTLSWYATNSSTAVLGTGTSFNTGAIASTTQYYVSASVSGCSSARSVVTATVNTAQPISVSANQTVCNGEVATLAVTPNANYTSYSWSPTARLFQNNTATTGYTNQNLDTVYAMSTTAGSTTYTVTASNSSTGCTTTATTQVRVLPATATVAANPTSICAGGSSTIRIIPITAATYGAATIEWWSSSDNITYTNTGSTGLTYTASPTSNTYYQAIVKNVGGTTCITTSPVLLSVGSPLVLSTQNGSACGTSIVALQATGTAGSTLNWYTDSIGGTLVGTGATFYTPAISATTVYYVEAANGTTCASTRVAVTATINSTSATALTVSANQTVCNNAVATLTTPSNVDYDTYVWSPATGLFNDNAATTAYTGGNLLTVYAQNATAGSYDYYVTASNSTAPGCVATVKTTVNVLPDAITVSAGVDTICNSGSTTLSITPSTGYAGGSILWQSSTNGFVSGTPTDLGSAATQSTGTLSATTWFRAIIKDGAGANCIISDPYEIVVNTPVVLSATGGSRCGTGTVTLTATAAAGTTLRWYSTLSSSTVLGTGSSFTTPSISTTTNYYVAASINSCVGSAARTLVTATINPPSAISATPSTQSVCNGGVAAITAASNPDYDTYIWSPNTNLYQDANASAAYTGQNQQTVYYKSTTAGTNTVTLTASASVGGCTNTTTAQVLVMPASITLSSTPAQICGTGTAVLSFTPSTGFGTGSFQWQTASSLAGPYTDISGATAATYTTGTISSVTYFRVVVKDGSGNDCFTSTAYTLSVNNPTVLTTTDGSVCGSGTVTLSATTASGNTLSWFTAPSGGSSVGTGASFTTPSISANTVYYVAAVNSGCVGARTAVNATITPASALTLSANQTVCNNAIATISVTPNSDYTNYQWTPRTNLFTNAGATTAYPANNTTATTVYVKSLTAGNYTYTVTATNSLTGCTKTGTTTVIVQPSTSVIGSAPSAICVKDKATLSLTPSPSSNVIWSQSPDGIAPYAPISGATSITYVTDSIIATSYFQAEVRNSTGGTCYTTNAYILDIDNPAVTAVSNANRCGSGVLTLTASGTGGTINWYASKTSNASLGTGSTFTTPSLSSTTVYYVSAVTASGCASAKTDALTDTAFINVAPALTMNSSQVVCNNSTNYMLNVTSNSADYTNFLWTASPTSPIRLYQDSLSATVYNSATMNEDTVYANVSTPGTTTYTLNATNTITGCSASTSAFLSVLPANTTVTASPSQLCVAGTANLALVPSGPYPIGTIQWQGSPDGITWSNIALATSNTLTTIIQGNTRYYRSVISNSNGNACITTPTTVLTVNNPQVVSTTPTTRCGVAPATLFATASAGATLNWYAQATGGALLGTGTSFTTPAITETTTYYVEAAIGSCVGGRTAVTVTYIAPPALTLTSLQSICSNTGIAQIDVTSPLANFDTYVWSCDINSTMYIDAAATIPYTGQNITTIYTKSDSGYTGTFTVNAISGTGPLACVNSANAFVSFVDVNIASVTSTPAIVCKGSTVTLTATADALVGTGPQVQPSGYLASSATSTADEEIFGVSFGTLSNTSVCGTVAPGAGSVGSMYSNYMGLTPPTVLTGSTVAGTLTLAYCASTTAYSNTAGVYIDWNRDGDFADAGEFVVQKPYGPLPLLNSPVTYTFNATVPTNATPGVTRMRIVFVESATMNPTGTYTWGETEDYLINVISFVQPTLTYTWTPGGLTGATTTDFITANTLYTVTGTDPVSGCSATGSLQVNVTNGPAAPTATDATQCGLGIPTASVTSNSGATAPAYTWYSAASSGTVLQAPGTPSGSSTYLSPINATQTFYVSEFDGTCNSYPRTPVTVTVNQPDAVVASSSTPTCSGSPITLTATQTGTTNSYVYTWTSTTNSGITTPVTGSSVSVTPTANGTYTYTVTAFDAASNCTTTSNVTVNIVDAPAVTVTPTSSTVCVGTPVQLTANETNGGSFGVTFNGTNAYLAVAPSASLNLSTLTSNSLTLEAWIRPTTATQNAGIISKYQSPAGAGYFIRQSSISPFTGIGAGGATEILSTPSTGLYTLNNWIHVAAVFSYNSSAVNDSVKIYKDGVLVRSGVTGFVSSPDSLRIGSDFGARYFNGAMDEVRIWNSAIDEATLNTWKARGVNSNHPNYANLVAYYDFNQPNATTSFTDLSGNGNTAYIRNAAQAIVNAPISNSATTYSWSPSAGLSNANIANPIATLTSAGTVNYTVTVTNGAGCTTTATIPVTAITTAGAPTIASSASGVCISGSVNLSVTNANASVSYQWQQSSTGAVGSFTNISSATATTYATPAISATTYYRVYATCGTATADTSDALTITAYTPAVTATVDSTRCGPGTVTLGATGNAGTVLNWYANPTGGSPIATGTSYTTPLLNNSTTYYVSATSPAATSTGFVGKTGTTGADGANTGTGIGPIFDALSPFTILTVDLYPNAAVNGTPGTATFTLQNSAGTTLFTTPAINILGYNTATVQTVNVNIPVAAAGTGYRLLVSWTGVTGMYRDFTTTGPDAVTFPYTLPGVCSITGSTSIATYYYYIYNWQVTVPCESGRVPVTATVTPSPAVTIAASASTICQGQSSVLTASSSDTNYVYTWNGGAFTGAAYTVSPTQAPSVTYNVVANNATTGCSALASQTVNVNISPTTPVITSSSAISCVGGSTTLTASSIAIGQGPQTDPGSSAGNPSFSSPNDEEIFNVTLGTLNNSSICSDVASGPGSVNSSYNNYTTTVAAPTLQVGNTYNGSITIGYCATGTFTNVAVMWIDYNRNGLFTDAGETVYTKPAGVSALTGTAYPFTVTIPSNATAGLTRMRVVVDESSLAPTPTIASTWGEGEDYLVNILAQVPVTTFNWSTGGTTPSISVNPTQGTTTYTVTTTAANGCTSGVGSFSITANEPPTPVLSATDTTLCAPNSINIFAVDNGTYSSGYPAGTSVEWLGYGATGDPATTPINSSQGSTFQAKVTLPSGCFANSNVVTVTTRDIVVVPTITPAACGNNNGKVVAQIASAPATPYNYVWSDGTNIVRNVTTASTTDSISGLAAGTYFLSVYDNQGGSLSCSATNLSYTVTATVPPVIDATSTNITCNGTVDGTVGVSITSGGVAPFTYSWSNGVTTVSQLGLAAGTYTVTVSDVYGCSSSSTVTVTEPAAIAAVETITQPCVNATNGSISLVVSGGTSPVNVDWFDASSNQLTSGNTLTGIGAGTYFALLTDANNCTTIGEYNVIATGQTFTSSENACDSYVWSQNAQTYTASGSYTSTSGCDTYVLNLTVTPSTSNTTSITACGSYTWSVNGTTYTTSGTYSSVTGCNTEFLNLSVTPIPSIPTLACYETATFNTTTCSWDVTGSPAAPIVTTESVCSTYTWSANGTVYTQSGTYNYSSNCQDYTLNLTVANVSISGLAPSSGAVGSTVVISGSGFTGATGVSFNGTAATSFTVNNSGQITATVPVGTTTGPVTVAVGQCSATSSGNFTIGTSATLNLKAYMQGYYAGSGTMTPVLTNQGIGTNTNEVDTITVQLRDAATGANVLASASGVIMTDGTISLTLPADVVGNSYYIVVNHRNTVQTWSATPVTMTSTTSFDFTTAASKAYGDNMIEVETGVFAMYTGDVNQDEFVDPIDYPSFELDNVTFAGGYLATDLNGDGFVDPIDYPVFELNNVNFVMSAHP